MKSIITYILLISFLVIQVGMVVGQSVGIGTDSPDSSAMLDITSTNKGVLVPRMTSAERDGISTPANGLMVYVITDSSFYFYEGNTWAKVGREGWLLSGNTGTTYGTNYIGTADGQDLMFKVNGQVAGRIEHTGTQNTSLGFMALSSTIGGNNTANGLYSLTANSTGYDNTAIGSLTLLNNTSGHYCTANGSQALVSNTSGSQNVANGYYSLVLNTTGSHNTASGNRSLLSNTTGSYNAAFGSFADVASGNLINATAIGAKAFVAANNSLVLGSINGVNGATANTHVGIGTTIPDTTLHIVGGLKYVDGNQGIDKVLTSDANGLASWQTAAVGLFQKMDSLILPNTSVVDLAKDNFVFGSNQLDNDGNPDHYARFFFDKYKHAFRAGYVSNNDWNEDSIGVSSIGLGYIPKATGLYSISIGNQSKAIGVTSFASGFKTTASGDYSSAMGDLTIASGSSSMAMGYQTVASGSFSTAMGNQSTASGGASTSMGFQTIASGNRSTALGNTTLAQSYSETAIGSLNDTLSSVNATSFASDSNRVFTVGNGTSNASRNTAFVIQQNGNVGVNTRVPTEKLDITGSIKIVDGAQGIGKVLTSDANGKASWQIPVNTAFFTQSSADTTNIIYSDTSNYGKNFLVNSSSVNYGGTGLEAKIMFMPSNGAFRAGVVNDTTWNESQLGLQSFAAGFNTTASGARSVALGQRTIASGTNSFAVGNSSAAYADYSTALGRGTTAWKLYSTAMGSYSTASGFYSTAMGTSTIASGDYSTATGHHTTASGGYSTGMGSYTIASGFNSTAMGDSTIASGDRSTATGYLTTASGINSTAIGYQTNASGDYSTATGNQTNASGLYSTATGLLTHASSNASTATGNQTNASGGYSTAMGLQTSASGITSLATGYQTNASGGYSMAMGYLTTAIGSYSTATGKNSTATGNVSTAMGNNTTASGSNSTSIGNSTVASGGSSTAIGINAEAKGNASTAIGKNALAKSFGELAIGSYNDTLTSVVVNVIASDSNRVFTVGNGTGDADRKTAFVIQQNGNIGVNTRVPAEKLDITGGIKINDGTQGAGKVLTSDANGKASWQATTNDTLSLIADADGNTIIQVEESPNEDVIHFDVAGNEMFTMTDTVSTFKGTGRDLLKIKTVNNAVETGLAFQNAGSSYTWSIHRSAANIPDFVISGGNTANDVNTLTERLRITTQGNVGIGTDTATVKFQVGKSGDGTVARANAWNIFSDRRWKTDLAVITNAMEKIEAINGYYYKWRDRPDTTIQVGVIAQEIEAVLPEVVSTDAEGYKSVDYSKITALLIQGMKEQQEQMKAQEERINQLDAGYAEIRAELNSMRSLSASTASIETTHH